MSTLLPSFTFAPLLPFQERSPLKIRAQSFRDEGRSSNLVDPNLKILKDRIDIMRTKERLERNCRPYGWDYDSNYIRKPHKRSEYPHTIALICGASSLPILIGTALLYSFSVIAHLNL